MNKNIKISLKEFLNENKNSEYEKYSKLVECLMNDIENKYPVDLWIQYHKFSHTIILSKIVIEKNNRERGIGSNVMNDISHFADKHKMSIGLTPSSDFGGSKKRLIEFYKKYGFEKYKGYKFKESMIRLPNKYLNENYHYIEENVFKDTLLDLSTLDLEDEQVIYPNINNKEKNHLLAGINYNLYILDRKALPNSGAYEIIIENDDDEIIGFIRGTKKDNILSFNLIHIQEDNRNNGIGTDIYERFLDDGYIIKSDDEITDSTYSLYLRLLTYGYEPIIFDDNRVGLKKYNK